MGPKGWIAVKVFISISVFTLMFYFSDLLAGTAVRMADILGLGNIAIISWLFLGILAYTIYKVIVDFIVPLIIQWAMAPS